MCKWRARVDAGATVRDGHLVGFVDDLLPRALTRVSPFSTVSFTFPESGGGMRVVSGGWWSA